MFSDSLLGLAIGDPKEVKFLTPQELFMVTRSPPLLGPHSRGHLPPASAEPLPYVLPRVPESSLSLEDKSLMSDFKALPPRDGGPRKTDELGDHSSCAYPPLSEPVLHLQNEKDDG